MAAFFLLYFMKAGKDQVAHLLAKKAFLILKDTLTRHLPDNKILDWSKFKQIADNILK